MESLHSSLHHPAQRAWSEPHIHPSQLMYPLFVTMRTGDKKIPALEPEMQWGQGVDVTFSTLVTHLQTLIAKGLTSVMLFGVVDDKDERSSMADDESTPVIKCTAALRKALRYQSCSWPATCACESILIMAIAASCVTLTEITWWTTDAH
ncbi:hypothetical protein PsorP6_012330 [Peronosclerospora sorghi]|uniref:Uncharacterized protein n=1 Tax=Peronosclerospora sorghi TaxID=230839 RepID=A0ACC0WHN4_9STRA|nr:hypothetical protein PsorP6_012330 [Peronosclerospora sorghi]